MMPHTNQKSAKCKRWNNEVITIPFSRGTFANSKHLLIATSLTSSVWILRMHIHARQHYKSIYQLTIVRIFKSCTVQTASPLGVHT